MIWFFYAPLVDSVVEKLDMPTTNWQTFNAKTLRDYLRRIEESSAKIQFVVQAMEADNIEEMPIYRGKMFNKAVKLIDSFGQSCSECLTLHYADPDADASDLNSSGLTPEARADRAAERDLKETNPKKS